MSRRRSFHRAVGRRGLGALLVLGSLAGCGSPTPRRDGGPEPTDVGPIDTCTARYALSRRRPEIELLVDRSCAMTLHFDGSPGSGPGDPDTRWAAVRTALGDLSASLRVSGMALFVSPDGPECSPPEPRVAPGGSTEAVLAAMDAAGAELFDACAGGTAGFGLESGLEALVLSDTIGATGDPFTIVVMGSAPACGETEASVGPVADDVGTDIAVVTLGVDGATAALADAIGVQTSAPDLASLAAAIGDIVRSRVSCTLDVVGGAPDPEALRVWVDGTAVPADPDEGWSYSLGDGAVTLNGSFCAGLSAETYRQVTAATGCDVDGCVPQAERCDGLDEDCDGTVDEGC